MAADLLDKIFDPYFSTKQTGSGLGLATVHSIIEKHRGHISVVSEPGQGTTFTILIPAERSSQRGADQASSGDVSPAMVAGRVLVVDDEEIIREVLVEMLALSGYTIDTADEGETGKEMYQEALDNGNPYNLVIMDLTIPGGMGGKEAVEAILDIDPAAKVIASSGYSTDPIMAKYLDYGFKGKLIKPFRLEDLQNEISRVMRT